MADEEAQIQAEAEETAELTAAQEAILALPTDIHRDTHEVVSCDTCGRPVIAAERKQLADLQ